MSGFRLSFAFILLSTAALAACESVPKKGQPVQLTGSPQVSMEVVPVAKMPIVQPTTSSGLEDRLAQLENQLAATRAELISIRPKVAKIDLIEQKFKDLSLGLDSIDGRYGTAPATSMKNVEIEKVSPKEPAKIEKPKTAKKQPETNQGGPATIKALRVGEQKGYTRLVLDTTKPLKISYDLDNQEKILVIETSGFGWDASRGRSYPSSPLVASYKAEGANLVIQLKKPVKILAASQIAAGENGISRSYLDIAQQ